MSTLNSIAAIQVLHISKRALLALLTLVLVGCEYLPTDAGYSTGPEYAPVPTRSYVGKEGVFPEISIIALEKVGVDAGAIARRFLESPDDAKLDFNVLRELKADELSTFFDSTLAELGLSDEYSYSLSNNFSESGRVIISDKQTGKSDGFLSNLFSSISSLVLMNELQVLSKEQAGDDKVETGKFIVKKIRELNPPVIDRCQNAFDRRLEEFGRGVGTDYDSFGMVVYDTVKPYHPAEDVPVQENGVWVGELYMCSWLGLTANFYYEFGFLSPDETETASDGINMPLTLVNTASLLASDTEFPGGAPIPDGVLNSIQMHDWKWKLHASGDRIHIHKAVMSAGAGSAGVDITSQFEIEHDCIDIFFKETPEVGAGGSYFTNLEGYCNGRCDKAVVNSGI